MMLEKRRYKRFMLDLIGVNGRLSLTDKVEIIDISFGGVALKADRRLNIGKEYLFTLGERALIYTAGMRFEEGSTDKIADFIRNSILA